MEKNTQNNVNTRKTNKKKSLSILVTIVTIIIIGAIIIYAVVSEDNYISDVSSFFESQVDAKPIIYLYPEEQIQLSVKLGKEANITCTYPEYKNGWNVIAKPDGKLIDIETGRNLYALYWEGIHSEEHNITEGFVVKGNETLKFLEEKLEVLGLNEIEAQEFIVFWLPILQENEYNYINFATLDEINRNMPLEFSVEPDTLIRVLMQYKPLDGYKEVKEQKLITPERKGFTVVEWGGTEIK